MDANPSGKNIGFQLRFPSSDLASVHGAYIHCMDGNAGHFTCGFPSTDLAYTESPSTVPIFTVWTGMQNILTSDSRPLTLHTQNPRPRCHYSQYGRECRAFYPRIPVHRPCIRKIPVPAKSMQYTRAISPIHHFAPSPSRYLTLTPHFNTRTLFYILLQFCISPDPLCIIPHRYNHLCTFCHLNNYRCHASAAAQQPRLLPGSSRTQETAGAAVYDI